MSCATASCATNPSSLFQKYVRIQLRRFLSPLKVHPRHSPRRKHAAQMLERVVATQMRLRGLWLENMSLLSITAGAQIMRAALIGWERTRAPAGTRWVGTMRCGQRGNKLNELFSQMESSSDTRRFGPYIESS